MTERASRGRTGLLALSLALAPAVAPPAQAQEGGAGGLHPGVPLALATVAPAPAPAPAPAQAQQAGAGERGGARAFSFERLNRVYGQLIDDLSVIRIGPAEVALRSPEHALTILRHEATLAPGGDGAFETALELEIEGAGRISADVVIGSLKSKLTQELVVPRQTLRLEGAIAIRRDEEGYWIATRRMPATTEVRIESELGTQLFTVCRQMALVLVSLDCAAIERAVTLISVPLPEAGAEYLIALEDTTPEERRDFDRFLRASRAP